MITNSGVNCNVVEETRFRGRPHGNASSLEALLLTCRALTLCILYTYIVSTAYKRCFTKLTWISNSIVTPDLEIYINN